MAKPEREFSAVVGQKSMGTAGPEYIKKDLDKAFAMLDPNKTLPDGSPGGIGLDNMQQGAVNDEVIGNREIDDTQAPIGNIGFLSTLLNWIAYVLKSILGTSWRTTPAITLPQVKAHVDAPSPHTEHETKTGAQAKVDAHGDKKDNPHNVSAEQVGAIVSVDGVSNPGGNIDLVAGAGVDLTPDNVGKKITISAKNDSIIPGKHATTHGSGGSDPVTPASIGAATSKHATAHGSGGSDPITPASIGAETPAGAQAKANEVLKRAYPIGSVYINASVTTNPATLLGFGTWEQFGTGRCLVGIDSSQSEFNGVGKMGGAKTHTLTVTEMPSHDHAYIRTFISESVPMSVGNETSAVTDYENMYNTRSDKTGSNQPHNNLQPYITVYMWKRIT